jgi:hypothetical protein
VFILQASEQHPHPAFGHPLPQGGRGGKVAAVPLASRAGRRRGKLQPVRRGAPRLALGQRRGFFVIQFDSAA